MLYEVITQAKLVNDKWEFNLTGIKPLLYNLPEVVQGVKDNQTIYVVEGEKDVQTLKKHKKIATCNTHGAGEGKWLSHYNDYLINSNVIIISDNDSVGKCFSKEIANNLVEVRITSYNVCYTKLLRKRPMRENNYLYA